MKNVTLSVTLLVLFATYGECQINFGSSSISENKYPRTIGFRNTEAALLNYKIFLSDDEGNLIPDTISNAAWLKAEITEEEIVRDMERFSIISGKGLEEEKTGNLSRVIDGYNRVRDTFPETTLLLHFNGRNRRPQYFVNESDPFFPGHWILDDAITPSLVSTSFPSNTEITMELLGEDLSTFVQNGEVLDELFFLIYELDQSGNPNYYNSEYILATGVDSLNRIIFTRDQFGLGEFDFQNDNIEIAQLAYFKGRIGYNVSNTCPLDSLGRTATDVLIDEIEVNFSEGGILEKYDGIIFDASTVSDQMNFFNIGFENDVYQPIVGYIDFIKRLRERMGSRFLISADNRTERHQRAFKYLNGIESEGWPQKKDNEHLIEWSSGVARHIYTDKYLQEPKISHFNTNPILPNEHRITQAAAAVLGAAHTAQYRLRESDGVVSGYYDEMCNGEQFDFSGWLGKAESEMIRTANLTPNILSPSDIGDDNNFIPGNETLLSGLKSSELLIEGIAITQEEIYIELEVEAEGMAGYPDDMPRLLWIEADNIGNDLVGTEISECKPSPYSGSTVSTQLYHIDEDGETIGLYLRWLTKDMLNLHLRIEGFENARVKTMRAYNAPDVLLREFENGIVIANPAAHEVEIDLSSFFPEERFKKINGFFQPEINNGDTIQSIVTVPCIDGMFLEKINTTSVADINSAQNFKVSPNPTKDHILVELNDVYVGNVSLAIHSLSGERLYSEYFSKDALELTKSIDISDFNSGLFLITYWTGINTYSQKLIKL